MNGTVYALFGRRPTAEEWQEEVLAEVTTPERAQEVKAIAERNGWVGCRIVRDDLLPPMFGANLLNI